MSRLDAVDDFTRAYIECALWSSNDESDETGGEPLDRNYGPEDLADEAIDKIVADCAKFQTDCAALLERAKYGTEWSDEEMAGHDFWLTRCGHGAGFWDGYLPKAIGDALTEAAKRFGECNLIVGDDGKIHIL